MLSPIEEVTTVVAPPRGSRRILSCEQVNRVKRVDRVTRLLFKAAQYAVEELPPQLTRTGQSTANQERLPATESSRGKWKLKADPRLPNLRWSLTRRARDDADLFWHAA